MAKMVQIRNVPDDVHAELTRRAKEAGMTLSAYLLREVERIAARPSPAELVARAERRGGRFSYADVDEILRRDRESH